MDLASLRIPLRYRILITLLMVVTVVVSIITFTMANLFHRDKTTYIRDLTSYISLHTAQETGSLLNSYEDRLRTFAKIAYDSGLGQAQKASLLKRLFEDSREFVAITLHEEGMRPVTVYDTRSLHKAGLAVDRLAEHRARHPLPRTEVAGGAVFVEYSTLTPRLPAITLTTSFLPAGARKRVVIEAVVSLAALQAIVSSSSVFEIMMVDSRGDLMARGGSRETAGLGKAVSWLPKLEGLESGRSASTTVEFARNGKRLVGGFARDPRAGLLIGVLIPREAAYLTGQELLTNLMAVALMLLILAAFLSTFWARRITSPLEQLSEAARVVGSGSFDIRLERSSRDEIGDLAETFNQMASELARRVQELKNTQLALVQSEKMAAFGQLGAGIAHEVKNPLAGILGFAQLSLRKADKESPLYRNLEMIERETKRCKNIIENLLRFARQERVTFQLTDLNQVVDDAVAIVDHQLGLHQIRVERHLAPSVPPVMGNANQIQQVLMNLLINAQQAFDGAPGVVNIFTGLRPDGMIEIRVADSGPGIPENIQPRLFEPFFTTKPAGKGTGLGLSVSYGIIKDHQGDIQVKSAPGNGAEFIITLPPAPHGTPPDSREDHHGQIP